MAPHKKAKTLCIEIANLEVTVFQLLFDKQLFLFSCRQD